MGSNSKERILKSAMELLIEKDISQITTREVVKKAEVNISQLHYYFKTKNDLFCEALTTSTKSFFRKWIDGHINIKNPHTTDIERYIGFIIDSIHLYPTINRSIVYMILQGLDPESISFGYSHDLKTMISMFPAIPENEITHRVHLLGQIIISLRVTTSLIHSGTGLDFDNKDDRRTYNSIILKQIFPELNFGDR